MKQAANRPEDRIDIEKLRIIGDIPPDESERNPAERD
jgi:hypothetical protein